MIGLDDTNQHAYGVKPLNGYPIMKQKTDRWQSMNDKGDTQRMGGSSEGIVMKCRIHSK